MSKKLTAQDKIKLSKVWVLKHGTGAFTTSSKPSNKNNEE